MVSRLSTALKALHALGPQQIGQFALYRLALRTGWMRRATRQAKNKNFIFQPDSLRPLLALPDPQQLRAILSEDDLTAVLKQAEDILEGRIRLFGGEPVPLQLSTPEPLAHWTAYATGLQIEGVEDIKFIWEPGRFGWATILGRAYWLSTDERYPQAFWHNFETFLDANPPYLGPHWMSAQEVALRLLVLCFSGQIFAASQHSNPKRMARLAQSIAEHAARIPASLAYARAQNNNHLLSEAAGLYTAGLALTDYPESPRWRAMGWKWFQRGLQTQIDPHGGYIQQSTNYHRLMLQLGLWMDSLSSRQDQPLHQTSQTQLARATRWLLQLLDHTSGMVPNLGPNDGAYILPLTVQPFADFRPVLQAAGQAFLGETPLDHGAWDEMALWLPGNPQPSPLPPQADDREKPARLALPSADSWAYLRAASFTDRPGHADQLHFDLWWRGLNIAQDAGTYLYNGLPPWENALARTRVHNTIIIDGKEQMTWAGRFLWLDWSQGAILQGEKAPTGLWTNLTASHNGYQKLGCLHQRSVTAGRDEWLVQDQILPAGRTSLKDESPHLLQLHWLLPDWRWELEPTAGDLSTTLRLESPYGWLSLAVCAFSGDSEISSRAIPLQLELIRAGERLHGSQIPAPTMGWVSPTYGRKNPALSATYMVIDQLPVRLLSRWNLPPER